MYRNRYNNEVRPFVVEVPIGKRGAALIGLHSMLGQIGTSRRARHRIDNRIAEDEYVGA